MLRSQFQFFRILIQLCDGILVLGAWALAYWIRFHSGYQFMGSGDRAVAFAEYLRLAPGLILSWYLSLQLAGAYKNWGVSRLGSEVFSVLRGSVLAFLILITGIQFFAREDFSRVVLALSFVLATALIVLGRTFLSVVLIRLRKSGRGQKNLLLLGDASILEQIQKRVQARPDLGFTLLGAIFTGQSTQLQSLGTLENLESVIRENNISTVIISFKNDEAFRYESILAELVLLNVEVRVIPDISQFAILGFEVESFEGLPLLTLNQSPIVGWNAVLKRFSDILYSFLLILLFGPVMFVIALIVRFTSRGPILYGQERMGLDGKTFKMWKFRSMRIDAETETGAVWAKKDDDRTTWIGAILRKTSLDELPQFFNVFVGDMSCVGPRPERPVFVEKFRKEIPGYMLRHKVKAGITGWAQVNGLRGNTSLKDRIEYDLYYITHWSLALDLRIMFMTVFKGFINTNAY